MIRVETWVCEDCGRGWKVEVDSVPNRLLISGSTTCGRCGREGKRRHEGVYARIPIGRNRKGTAR